MKKKDRLIYLDRDFISTVYEDVTGTSAETKITKTEGLNAGARIPVFTAGISSVESKSYAISSVGMFSELEDELSRYPEFSISSYRYGNPSLICWLDGRLEIETATLTRQKRTITIVGPHLESDDDNYDKVVSEERYFAIRSKESNFALITTPDYFVSGVSSFQGITGTIIEKLVIPVRSLIRAYSAESSVKQIIAVPIIMFEKDNLG